MEDGFVTVVATFSRTSVTVTVHNGEAVFAPMQWLVEDSGRIESALTFKVGLHGCAPNKIGTSNCMSEQVRALATSIVYYGNSTWTVAEMSRNGFLSKEVGSLENADVTFTVQVETRYMPTPQQAQLVHALCADKRETLADIEAELVALSNNRRKLIMDLVGAHGDGADVERAERWFVRCPESSFSQMGFMDSTQMQALGGGSA